MKVYIEVNIPFSLETRIKLIAKIKKELNDKYSGELFSLVISGAHLYGFESKDSDIDIRGVYIVNTHKLLGLTKPRQVIDKITLSANGKEFKDIVIYELGKETRLLIKSNCNAFERLVSEPKLFTSSEYLDWYKKMLLTKIGVYRSYKGLAMHNYDKFISSGRKSTVKKYLYIFRGLMAGITTLEEHRIEPNINILTRRFKVPIIKKLVRLKKEGREEGILPSHISTSILDSMISRFLDRLDNAYFKSKLPDVISQDEFNEINSLIISIRKNHLL